jgi:predicted permease
MMDRLLQEARHAARRLRRARAFTATAVGTLAVVIGANTAIFSVVSAVLLRPLPYRDPDRLLRIWEANPSMDLPFFSASRLNFDDWRAQARSFAAMEAFRRGRANVSGDGEPETVETLAVTSGFFGLLGVAPATGRPFADGEDRPEATRVVVVGDAFARRRFGDAPRALGQSLRLDGQVHQVVGVLAPGFQFGRFGIVDVFLPLTPQAEDPNRRHHVLGVIGRLAAGTTRAAATAELETIAGRLAGQFPDSNRGWTVRVATFEEWIVDEEVRRALLVLLGAVGFVLLIACANLASLQLARSVARHREMAVRTALGAGRGRLLLALLSESLMVSAAGGLFGLALAVWGVDALRAALPPAVTRANAIGLDRNVLLFNLGASVFTGLLFGIVPALVASRQTGESLRDDPRTVTGGAGRVFRRALVGVEVALSIVLLVGAGLLVRTLLHLQHVPLGFQPAGVLSAQLNPSPSRYPDADRRRALYDEVLGRARALPGVTAAALTNIVPFGGGNSGIDVTAADAPSALAEGDALAVDWRAVSAGYFEAMRVPLLAGRTFAPADTARADGPCVVLASERLARSLWPDRDAVGRRLKTGGAGSGWCTVLGVVGNVKNLELGVEPRPALYLAAAQFPQATMSLLVRSDLPRAALLASLRRELAAADPELPLSEVRSLAEVLEGPAAQPRFNAALLGGLAGCALLLAAVGLYGLLSYWVAERTRELGVRMAVGAQAADVLALVMGQGMRVALGGVAAGAVLAWGASRLLRGLLFGVGGGDPATYALVGAVVAAIAALACYVPARRASRLDPLVALRRE